jgi:2-polyprenyl-3-methyl-5-hydroxy-6-metoxy-1,4-benzoquinol methylase
MPTARQLAKLYAKPHEHTKWFDHRVRVDVTVAIAAQFMRRGDFIADLSCGDAVIPRRLAELSDAGAIVLGDYAPGYAITGPIEQTIEQVKPSDSIDMWVCSETIEHLDDPDKVLRQIRTRTKRMILSTPMGETNPKLNPEHVWGWDAEAVGAMLDEAGFTPLAATTLDLRPAGYVYCYQIWMVE